MLRRLKGDTLGGRPILPLPPRRVQIVREELGGEERQVYRLLESRARSIFNSFLRRGGVRANYLHILALLTRLRQACNDPRLVQGALETAVGAGEEAMPSCEPTAAARARADRMAADGIVEDCPICMDTVLLDSGCLTGCGHPFCTECISEYIHRTTANDDDAVCPLCRGAVHLGELFPLRRLIPQPEVEAADAADAAGGEGQGGDGGGAGEAAPTSTKTRMAMEAVRRMLAADSTSKCLIFSSYTKYLDVLQSSLQGEGVNCARIDGSQRIKERERQISNFQGEGVPVLLMSLKCGVGLNLTMANTVILCEPWWNPFVEEQAIDRVHRIGQTKEVTVLRLAVPDTVEDRILSLQDRKRQLAEATLGDPMAAGAGHRHSAAARLSDDDLSRLFGSG